MNLAIDIRSLQGGKIAGVGEYVYNIIISLLAIDKTNQYFLFYNSAKNASPAINLSTFPNARLVGFHYPNKLLNLSLILFGRPKLDRLIAKKCGVDKINLFFFPNLNFFSVDCPYFITAHDLSYALFPEFLSLKRKLWHWLTRPRKKFQNAKKIIAVSRNTAVDLQSVYQITQEKIATIHSGIRELFFESPSTDLLSTTKRKYNLPDKFILYLGTIEPRKNIQALINGFIEFIKSYSGYKLIIAGQLGWKYQNILKQIRNNADISFIGYVDDNVKNCLYHLAAAFVFPSFYEGFGFPPLEAMAAGCPVVTAHTSSLPEICETAAILIDPHNSNDINHALLAMQDEKIKNFYIEAGKNQARKFNWATSAKKLLALINQI